MANKKKKKLKKPGLVRAFYSAAHAQEISLSQKPPSEHCPDHGLSVILAGDNPMFITYEEPSSEDRVLSGERYKELYPDAICVHGLKYEKVKHPYHPEIPSLGTIVYEGGALPTEGKEFAAQRGIEPTAAAIREISIIPTEDWTPD